MFLKIIIIIHRTEINKNTHLFFKWTKSNILSVILSLIYTFCPQSLDISNFESTDEVNVTHTHKGATVCIVANPS